MHRPPEAPLNLPSRDQLNRFAVSIPLYVLIHQWAFCGVGPGVNAVQSHLTAMASTDQRLMPPGPASAVHTLGCRESAVRFTG
jgi:hypothetical protein